MCNIDLCRRTLARCICFGVCAVGWGCIPANVQADFVNGDFETGDTSGWTISVGELAEATNVVVTVFDMDDSGPGAPSRALQLAVGQSTNGDSEYRNVDVTQDLLLVAGTQYDFSFDWASHNYFFLDNFDGGVFELIVDGQSLAVYDVGSIFLNSTEWGELSGSFVPDQTGMHAVGARISRRFRSTNNGTFILGQYLDNFSMVQSIPEPGLGPILLMLGLIGCRRRIKRRTG